VEQTAMEYDSEFNFPRFMASILNLNMLAVVSIEARS